MIFIDNLNLFSLMYIYFNKKIKIKKIFYLELSINNKLLNLCNYFFKLKFSKLSFDLRSKDNFKYEWIESYLANNDFKIFEKKIMSLINNINKIEKLKINKNYILKGLLSGHRTMDRNKLPYLINFINTVIYYNEIIIKKKNINIILLDNEFKSIFINVYKKGNINFFFIPIILILFNRFNFNYLKNVIRNLQFLKFLFLNNNFNKNQCIYVESAGDLNLSKNIFKTDFFFELYSNLKKNIISYIYFNEKQKKLLIKNKIFPIKKNINYLFNNRIITPHSNDCKELTIKYYIYAYLKNYKYWNILIKKNNIKIYLTWKKYSNTHIVLNDTLNNNNSILAIWQRSYESNSSYIYKTFCDVYFRYGFFDLKNDKKIGNAIKNNIIVGFLGDYNNDLVKVESKKIRNNLHNYGVKKIISFFDQNSIDEFMHINQRECYLNLLDLLLSNEEMGLIIKPKKIVNLYERLGNEVASLLKKALLTKRCIIFKSYSRYHSNIPVSLASKAADLSVHSNLFAGSAGIESALSGTPTIILDRENDNKNQLNVLQKNEVIFNDWLKLNNTLVKFIKNKIDPNLGNWKNIINDIDPFLDGKGSVRMGNYLNDLMTSFKNDSNKQNAIDYANERYIKQWGSDKIITSN